MAYPIEKKLVIAVASSALFDLSDSDKVYREQGVDAYRKFQRKKENVALRPGVAFPLVRRLLRLNDGFNETDAPVEVVLLSRNDPDTGLRVVNSIEKHKLGISRAVLNLNRTSSLMTNSSTSREFPVPRPAPMSRLESRTRQALNFVMRRQKRLIVAARCGKGQSVCLNNLF